MSKPVGVLRWLGTNCDADVIAALEALKIPCEYLWWKDHFKPEAYSAFILPGGFSYGDYLRAGALAARAPAMDDLRRGANAGAPVLGICNGFQILCEAGLLPGALTKNISRRFQDEWVGLKVRRKSTLWSEKLSEVQLLLPIAHSMGRYFAPESDLAGLFDNDQVWLTYTENPNGALRDIAGITNKAGNVAALMPHPERAIFDWMGGATGRNIFEVLVG
jgi:phosphoribosylformylglycinamidine synthase